MGYCTPDEAVYAPSFVSTTEHRESREVKKDFKDQRQTLFPRPICGSAQTCSQRVTDFSGETGHRFADGCNLQRQMSRANGATREVVRVAQRA